MRSLNLVGKIFGILTVIERIGSKNGRTIWLCRCECGVSKQAVSSDLTNGHTRSCGCLQKASSTAPNIVGQKFGRLTVISRAGSQNGKALWLCLCECGNTTNAVTGNLNNGLIKSCGCIKKEILAAKAADLIGQKFGRLTVTARLGSNKNNNATWLCECECGNTKQVISALLTSKHTQSCGCLQKEIAAESAYDLTGQKFGRLTVIKRIGSQNNKALWLCECECGNTSQVVTSGLINETSQSCGCLKREFAAATGASGYLKLDDFRAYLNQRGFELKSEIDEKTWTGPFGNFRGTKIKTVTIECIHNPSHVFTWTMDFVMSGLFDCPECHRHEGLKKHRVKAQLDAIFEAHGLNIQNPSQS